MSPVVSIHDQLVSSCDKLKVVSVIKLFRNVLTEGVTSSSWRNSPSASFIWVRPQQIANWTFLRWLLLSVQSLNLFEGVNAWGQTSVETEDLLSNDSGQRKEVEESSQFSPDIGVSILSEALVIETIHLSDGSALVVSSQNGDSVLMSDFQGHQQSDGLNGVVSSVNIIAHE